MLATILARLIFVGIKMLISARENRVISQTFTGINKRKIRYSTKNTGFFNLAEQEGFEPSVPFWGTHDFQSCPL